MLQISQIRPRYRFGGCLGVSTSLKFLKISIYFSSNHPLYVKQERKTDGQQDADTAGPRFFNCIFSSQTLLKEMKYRIVQYKFIRNQSSYVISQAKQSCIGKQTIHSSLKMFKLWRSQFLGVSHLHEGQRGELISVSPRNSFSASSLETHREVNNNQLEAEIPRIRSFQDFPLCVKAINSYF